MPSYRYLRDIDPEDLAPEKDKDYTKKEKAGNWWHYHWKWIAAGFAVLLVIAFFVRDVVSTPATDFSVGIIAPRALPDELVTKLEDGLAAYAQDQNGDGQVVVSVQVFTVSLAGAGEGETSSAASQPASAPDSLSEGGSYTAEDPYAQMAGVTQLSAAISAGEPLLYLVNGEEAQDYQDFYGLYGMQQAEDVTAYTVAWQDVPALAQMDLHYTGYDGTVYDGQEYMADYRVGVRALSEKDLEKHPEWADNLALVNEVLAALGA